MNPHQQHLWCCMIACDANKQQLFIRSAHILLWFPADMWSDEQHVSAAKQSGISVITKCLEFKPSLKFKSDKTTYITLKIHNDSHSCMIPTAWKRVPLSFMNSNESDKCRSLKPGSLSDWMRKNLNEESFISWWFSQVVLIQCFFFPVLWGVMRWRESMWRL